MTIFIIPALLALFIKLGILSISRLGNHKSKVFTTMLIMIACHNVAEVFGYVEYFNGMQMESIVRWYYVMTIGSLFMIGLYAQEVSGLHANLQTKEKSKKGNGNHSRKFNSLPLGAHSVKEMIAWSWLAIAVILAGLVMFTNVIVAGTEPIAYSVKAIQGGQYWLFIAFSLSSFFVICCYLLIGYRKADSHLTEIRCSYTMLALSPIVLTSLILILLMSLGYEINAAAVMPLASAAFLVITLMGENAHGLTDIRRHVPFSLERKTSGEIMTIFSQYAQDDMNYRDALNEIETLLVMHKHQKHNGNVSSTAASMELPRSSLYSIFRRLDIEIQEQK